MNGLLNLLRDVEEQPTDLQRLQLGLLDLIRQAHECDERIAEAFVEFLIGVAAREAKRRAM